MNENSFNVCSRCGGANPLSARYCYQCGYELKSPEAPVVCTKCNTVNQGSANFCKRCGSKLPKAQTKTVCPQCSASNVAGATFCANCGFDFTTSTMPSAVALAGQLERQDQVVATNAEVVSTQDKKLSFKERRKLKREEEERAYREELEAKKQAKLAKKQAKKQPVQQQVAQPVVQPQMAQYPVVIQQGQVMPFVPPVAQQTEVEQSKPKAKKHRLKNLVVLLIALVGLYLVLLPEQFNLFKSFNLLVYTTASVNGVAMTGWDVLIAVLSNFAPGVTSLSTVASANVFDSIEILITAVVLAFAVIQLVIIVLAKLLGIITGKAHKGVDANAIISMLITGGAVAYGYFHGVSTIEYSLYSAIIPAIFLLVAIFNSKIKKD